jgi:hypothetical protein
VVRSDYRTSDEYWAEPPLPCASFEYVSGGAVGELRRGDIVMRLYCDLTVWREFVYQPRRPGEWCPCGICWLITKENYRGWVEAHRPEWIPEAQPLRTHDPRSIYCSGRYQVDLEKFETCPCEFCEGKRQRKHP